MPNLYLPMDNETGGLADNASLLSTYLEVVDDQFNIVDSLELYVKPNDGVYMCQASGLDINKINLVEHDKVAITYSEAGQELFRFLKKNSYDGKVKLIPVGKNVQYDVLGLQKHLLSKPNMNKFVSYRLLDVTTMALALQIKGKLPYDMGLSLSTLAEHFNVLSSAEGQLHEAKYDTKLTMAVFVKLLELM